MSISCNFFCSLKKQKTAVPVDHLELYLSLTTDVVMRFWITVLELHAALWNGHFVIGVKLLCLEKLQIYVTF